MKRIGLVTIYAKNPNFGNKLQNYAVKTVYEKLGFSVDTFVTDPQNNVRSINLKRAINKISGYRFSPYQPAWNRIAKFECFNQRFLNPTESLLKHTLDKSQYDFFSVGSDQVWNPAWYAKTNKKDFFLLTFADDAQKLCFSPSFGVETLPEEWRGWFSEYLQKFRNISVREETGVKIVKELTGKDAVVLIDPTMMLDAEEWLRIARKPQKVSMDKPYLLSYFLGEKEEQAKADIRKYASEKGLEIFELNDRNNLALYSSGPSEFVYLLSHAELILTDSFHACVFSFLFNKPFYVYDRNYTGLNMNSRLKTLLSKFNLERKYARSGLENDIWEHNYEGGYAILNEERKNVMNFLEKSMGE